MLSMSVVPPKHHRMRLLSVHTPDNRTRYDTFDRQTRPVDDEALCGQTTQPHGEIGALVASRALRLQPQPFKVNS
jgi:hypothetical protein